MWRGKLRSLLLLLLIPAFQLGATDLSIAQLRADESERVPRTLELWDVGFDMPIKILAVRNLQKKTHWMRDLEIEIKNVSPKPIYGLYAHIIMPDDRGPGGNPVSVNMTYGRMEMMRPSVRPSANDTPIASGETFKLRVDELWWQGYEGHLASGNVAEQATYRVRMSILAINFGDGTGYTRGGMPYPPDPLLKSRPHRFLRIPLTVE